MDTEMDDERYNDERNFPDRRFIQVISMNPDGTLEASILRCDERMHYHGTIHNCPQGTKLYDYLLAISGPLKPYQSCDPICLTPDGSKIEPGDTSDINVFDFFKPGSFKKNKKKDLKNRLC